MTRRDRAPPPPRGRPIKIGVTFLLGCGRCRDALRHCLRERLPPGDARWTLWGRMEAASHNDIGSGRMVDPSGDAREYAPGTPAPHTWSNYPAVGQLPEIAHHE